MESKDPNGMTASELLRWAVNGEPYSNGLDDYTWNNPTGKIKALAEAVTGEWPVDLEAFYHIADKIDAELAQARELSLLQGAAIWAKANGWPDFKEGEDFTEWMNRCWLPIPRYEDGEPVDESDFGEDGLLTVYGDGDWLINCSDGGQIEGSRSQRVERPAPEALGADGLPVKVGETVYRLSDGTSWTVIELHRSELRISVMSIDGNEVTSSGWCLASEYTHTPPDTQEGIDGDVEKNEFEYWGCLQYSCANCPALIDGDKPWQRYDAASCEDAMVRDLLRRQRELDARTEGAE